MEGLFERNWRNVGGGGRFLECSCEGSGKRNDSSSPSIDLVLRVDALRRCPSMGRTGDDGVALSLRRCEFEIDGVSS